MDDLLIELDSIRTAIQLLQKAEKIHKIEQMDLESAIINKLEEQGIDRIGNNICTVSIRKEIVPTIENWDEVYTYIKETGQFELLHKRMAATAYRELQKRKMKYG